MYSHRDAEVTENNVTICVNSLKTVFNIPAWELNPHEHRNRSCCYINAQNFRHHKMAEILIASASADAVNYALEYKSENPNLSESLCLCGNKACGSLLSAVSYFFRSEAYS